MGVRTGTNPGLSGPVPRPSHTPSVLGYSQVGFPGVLGAPGTSCGGALCPD